MVKKRIEAAMKVVLSGKPKKCKLPVIFVVFALGSGLLVDSYRAWALNYVEPNCRPHFALLYFGQPNLHVSAQQMEQRAVLAWEDQVSRKYGAQYASFVYAKKRQSGVQQCYPDLEGPRQCAYAFGQPCPK